MKSLGLLFCAIFISEILSSQHPLRPYEKLNLTGPQPIWYETSFDSSLINENCDGFNNFSNLSSINPIFDGENIYCILEITTLTNYKEGALIQKIKSEDGEVIWSVLYDLQTLENQEVPFKMYLGNDGYLHVHGFRKRKDDNDESAFGLSPRENCRLTYRRINNETGEVLEFLTPEDNSQAASVIASNNPTISYGNIFLTKKNDEYIFWSKKRATAQYPVQQIYFQTVNKQGMAISDVDSTVLKGAYNTVVNFIQLNVDTLLYINFNTETQKVKFYYYDYDFRLLDSTEIEQVPGIFTRTTFVYLLNRNRLFIQSYDFKIDHSRFLSAAYDMKGNLLDFVDIKGSIFDIYGTSYNYKQNQILAYKSEFLENPLRPTIYLYSSDGIGGIKSITTWQSTDTLRIGSIQDIYFSDSNLVLFQFFESSIYKGVTYYRRDDNARAYSHMLFNAEDIGVKSVSSDDVLVSFESKGILYPNPSSDHSWILYEKQVSGVLMIKDQSGQNLQNIVFNNQNNILIPTNTLTSGLYFIQCLLDNGQIQNYKMMKL